MSLIPASSVHRIPRHWALVGFSRAGKSTFLTAMSQRILIVDTDGRGVEIQGVNGAEIFLLDLQDKQDPLAISQAIRRDAAEIHESGIQLMAVDTLTPIYRRSAAEAVAKNDRNVNKNRSSAFVDKANAIRLLQDSSVSLGLDIAILWHLEEKRDANARQVVDHTISASERKKLYRSLNAVILIENKNGRRSATVKWARAIGVPSEPMVFYDEEGFWKGVPEKIDQAITPHREHVSQAS